MLLVSPLHCGLPMPRESIRVLQNLAGLLRRSLASRLSRYMPARSMIICRWPLPLKDGRVCWSWLSTCTGRICVMGVSL
jgi:hypothetical protein